MSKTRIYEVPFRPTVDADWKPRLIEAPNPATAVKHVAKQHVAKAELADGKRVADLLAAGAKIEKAEVE